MNKYLIPALCGVLLLAGCGGKSVRAVSGLRGVAPGEAVRVEGELSLRGSLPATTLVLMAGDASEIALDSPSSDLMHELKGLAGMRVRVDGLVREPLDATLTRLEAESYELLPLPSGEVPVVGVVSIENNQCVLTTARGERWWLRGDLSSVLRDYVGARVWVVGDRNSTGESGRPAKSTPFTPTGYGVIDEAAAPAN